MDLTKYGFKVVARAPSSEVGNEELKLFHFIRTRLKEIGLVVKSSAVEIERASEFAAFLEVVAFDDVPFQLTLIRHPGDNRGTILYFGYYHSREYEFTIGHKYVMSLNGKVEEGKKAVTREVRKEAKRALKVVAEAKEGIVHEYSAADFVKCEPFLMKLLRF